MTNNCDRSDKYKREISAKVCNNSNWNFFIEDLLKDLTLLGIHNPNVIVMGRKYYVNNNCLVTDLNPTVDKAQALKDYQVSLSYEVYQTIFDLLGEVLDSLCQNENINIYKNVEVKLLGRQFTIGKKGLNIQNMFGAPKISRYTDIFPYNIGTTLRIE
jgi:hypothetical protein